MKGDGTTLTGRQVNLTEGRSVWLGKLPNGDWALEFINREGERTRLALSDDAALVGLYAAVEVREIVWAHKESEP